jgi:uncharacterized Fe-S cluster-containing MiaB family protein
MMQLAKHWNTPSGWSIKEKIEDAMAKEEIKSIVTVLVTLHNPQQRMQDEVKKALDRFHKDANLSQFVDIGDATAGNGR